MRPTFLTSGFTLTSGFHSINRSRHRNMRTRKSNKTKSFKAQTYDFEAEFSEDETAPRQPFADRALKEDDDFDAAGADPDESPDDDPDPDASASASDEEQSEPADVPGKVKTHARRRPQKSQSGPTKYFGIEKESVPGKHHVPLGYVGIPDRHIRGIPLAHHWYGPRQETQRVALSLLDRWLHSPYVPTREEPRAIKKGVWIEDVYEKEADHINPWVKKAKNGRQILRPLSRDEATPWKSTLGVLPTVTGTYDQQAEWRAQPLDSTVISDRGTPHQSNEESTGWLIDAGGLVVNLDWATRHEGVQALALAVIPHSDQDVYDYENEASKSGFQELGTVQIWEFEGTKDEEGSMKTAATKPQKRQLCFDEGRARRVAWSPAGHLAVICGGKVCVVDPETKDPYVKVERPLGIMALDDGIEATSLTWVTYNRLAIGYSDGSIALWSAFPSRLLSRHAIHTCAVISIASGYPTNPYSIASVPLGGHLKLFDLRNPSCETTEMIALSCTTQPGILQWSDHLRGFFSLTPSSAAINTTIGFVAHDFFPIMRRVSTLESLVTCIAVGKTHPFLLIGGLDGTLTAMNPQFELFQLQNRRNERAMKLKIFQHEHQPSERFPEDSPAKARGASRVIHGFKPEKNHIVVLKARQPTKSKRKKDEDFVEDDEEGDKSIQVREPKRAIVYEPWTRVTAVAWNPNEGYGTWAAAALGSGLVKVMDLGLA